MYQYLIVKKTTYKLCVILSMLNKIYMNCFFRRKTGIE